MAEEYPDGMDFVNLLGESAANHYRRCHSKDVIVVPTSWVKKLPNSRKGPTGFLPNEDTKS